MVGERSQADIVVHVQAASLRSEGLRGVLFAFPGEFFRFFAQVLIQYGIVAAQPGGGDFFVRIADDGIHIAFQHGVQLSVYVYFFAVVQSFVQFQRYDTVVFDCPGHIGGSASLSEVQLALHAYVLHAFFMIRVPYDKHRRQAHGVFAHTHDFRFEERDGGP